MKYVRCRTRRAFVSKPSRGRGAKSSPCAAYWKSAMAREFVARAKPADFKRIEQHT